MKNFTFQKTMAMLLALCMLFGATALGETAQAPKGNLADFEALYPLMDLVCAASQYSVNSPESVAGADGTLSASFIDAFVKAGLKQSAEVGVTDAMLTDGDARTALLGSIFAAQLPAMEPVVQTDDINSFVGFHPVMVNQTANNGVQILGELYMASGKLETLGETELNNVKWLERGVFSFQSDAAAKNGFRLSGFSVGTELDMEEAFQTYFEEILTEYVDTGLGFTVLYPAIFTDDMQKFDADGISASLEDGSVSFFAKRVDNLNGASLNEYVGIIADGITGCVSNINEELQCGTVAYTTDDGFSVFDVYVLTDKYIYQAELKTTKALMGEYSMFNAYLENSFVVDDISVG